MPETILGGDIPLRNEKVVLCGGFDVRNTVLVSANGYGSRKRRSALRGEQDFAVQLWKSRFRGGAKPENKESTENDERSQKPYAGKKDEARPSATVHAGRGNIGKFSFRERVRHLCITA